MEVIIIVNGQKNRLKHLTQNKPKCLLEIREKTILQYQLATFNANDITDICATTSVKERILSSIACTENNYRRLVVWKKEKS